MIRTIAVPSRSRMSRIRSRMPAWIVTSSAVVGSSAISTFGSQASAIAIITRWRMPPESWCGYSSHASFRRRDAHELEQLDRARVARLAPRHAEVLAAAPRAICRPTRERRVERRHRLLEDERDLAGRGSAAAAREAREQVDALEARRARRPPRSAAAAAASDMHVTLLPQPDSPTMPSTSPLAERERQPVDRVHGAVVGLEPDARGPRPRAAARAISASSAGRGRRAGRRRAG